MSGPVREAFEAWSEMFCLALDRRPTGTYESMRTHDTWCAYVAGRAAGMESAAKVCDAWAVKALAAQSVPPLSDMHETINTNLRMTAIGPTSCATAIRALAEGKAPPEGRECS